MNVLGSSDKPLFFKAEPASLTGIEAPRNRLGDAVRTTVRSLSAMQKEALVVSARTGLVWRLASDEGAYLDGDDEAPCPLSFLTTGMVCSYMEEILALARQRGIAIANIKLVQDNFYTMKGSALRGTMTGGAKDVQLEARIESPASKDTLTQLVLDATAASPLNGLMQRPRESYFSLTHNGRTISGGRALPIPSGGIVAVDETAFDRAVPAAGTWSELVIRGGMSPKTDETTGFAGSSLAEQQDRSLHVRGICSLRDDGIKQVEQLLFNPHGSIFRFLCEEAHANGGEGRAPDANTYISAGIAFCFMTQLGRYAKIARKDLRNYHVVQDTHFSLGGASGNTGAAGSADPIETHVHIESGEDDDFARQTLAMSEQTCFLHALCRAKLKTRVRLRPFEAAA